MPWFVVLQDLTPRRAFWWSYLVGLIFFLGSMWWLVHVTVAGWLILCAYLAVYFALFGWLVHVTLRERQATGDKRHARTCHLSLVTCRLLVIPSAWVALEYARSHLLTGLGWNLLGYSQTSWLSIIQIADVTGVWGVSFLLVMVNAVLARVLWDRSWRAHRPALAVIGVCVLAAWSYGHNRLHRPTAAHRISVAVVQGNIPQERKWDEASKEGILQQYERLTRQAASLNPQLIIWPETSAPGFLGWDQAMTTRLQTLAQSIGRPLLVGAPTIEPTDDITQNVRLLNSAILFDGEGGIVNRYDKLHLVPFGEFIPFESVMPWLRSVLPPIGDFISGSDYTVFQLPASSFQLPCGVLICFEDIFPQLARRFVQQGAQWLVVITNDAWFGKTAAAYQHAQASTLRAVELRVPVVRAANTGWSGCITDRGQWLASVRDAKGGELFVEGLVACDITLGAAPTLYERWGDWWAMLCVLIVAGFAIIQRRCKPTTS